AVVRNVQLPYDLAPNHGRDVRDWFREEPYRWPALVAMAQATPPAQPSAAGPSMFTTGGAPPTDQAVAPSVAPGPAPPGAGRHPPASRRPRRRAARPRATTSSATGSRHAAT